MTFDLEKYLVEKLDKIDQRLDETCQTLTEVKTTQANFIDEHERNLEMEMKKSKHRLDVRLAILAFCVAIFNIYGYFHK